MRGKALAILTLAALAFSGVTRPRVASAATDDPVLINELFASHTRTDTTEYLELYGVPGLSLHGLSLIVVEGDTGPAGAGTIDRRLDFSASDILGSNGYYLVGNPVGLAAFYNVTPNRAIRVNYFENSSLTVALVRTESLNTGVGSYVTGSEVVLDTIALSDGGAGDRFYFGAPVIGPDGTYFPAGVRRLVDGQDTDTAADWRISDFNLGPANTPTAGDTPPPSPPPVIPIGQVQGSVDITAAGAAYVSPMVGQLVSIQGVIYQKTLSHSNSAGSVNGFFIQNTAATADSDPLSSDGIFVFMGSRTTLGGYTPIVGDEVVLHGIVEEYYNLTQVSSASLVSFEQRGVNLEAEVPAFEAKPPNNTAEADRYWERHEGMRAQVPAGSLSINGCAHSPCSLSCEAWLVRSDSPFTHRLDPSARVNFRTPNSPYGCPAYSIILGSLGLGAHAENIPVRISPGRPFAVLANAPSGGVYFSSGKYHIMVEQLPVFAPGVDPSWNEPP